MRFNANYKDDMLKTIGFILLIVLMIHTIILVHEFGHYIAARIFKIKVKIFSIGLGKTLFSKQDKNGVIWRIGAFPLGGYVAVLDAQTDKVTKQNSAYTINIKPLWQKITLYFAGPAINLLFAIIIYSMLYITGINEVKPVIAKTIPNSIAAQANIQPNSTITKVNDKTIGNWKDVTLAFLASMGSDKTLHITTTSNSQTSTHNLDITDWQIKELTFKPLESLGIKPFMPNTPAVVMQVIPDSPAAGILKPGDKIIKVNNIYINNYEDLNEAMENLANKNIMLTIETSNITTIKPITTSWTFKDGWNIVGYIGIKPAPTPWPQNKINHIQYGPLQAIAAGIDATFTMLKYNFIILGKIITRIIPISSLSGPIGFLGVALASLNSGFKVFIEIVAIFNIIIAFANLLPIPGLDGGNIVFKIYEKIKGREIDYLLQQLIGKFAIIFLVVITIHATINDLTRLLS